MTEQVERNYRILATSQGIAGGVIATAIFGLYGLAPNWLSVSTTLSTAIMGAVGLVYFLTFHQLLSRRRLALSTLILTIITTVNILLVIISTGGLDSPYYSLWLLAIVVAGTFGRAESIGILGVTLGYYLIALLLEGRHAANFNDHLIQLCITLIAGALAEWTHSRNRQAAGAVSSLNAVKGQLSTEQIKADAIIQGIGEGVMVIDAARRIQIFNRAATELTGWDAASASNIDFNLVMQLKTTEDQPLSSLNDPFTQAWAQKTTIMREDLAMTTRSGRKVQLNISASPLFGADGQPAGAIALFRDISQEKEVERQKDEFVSTASHEMRTPVAAIEGYISLAMNPNVATIDDRAKAYLDKAHDTIRHLGDLFKDLLSVTKAEEGKIMSKIEPVNLDKLLGQATSDMQFTAQKKNLTLVYQVGGQSGKTIAPLFYVAANPERLREVVMNLMENAVKYTSQGGIKVTLEGNDKEATVSVADTGLGIAAEDIPHLFQKFYRVDSSATRTIGGTGLGLYLCRRVIEAFNGRIWIESELNKGSTFKFTLPRLSQDEVEQMQRTPTTGVTTTASTTPVTNATAPTSSAQPSAPAIPTSPPAPVAATPIPGTIAQPSAPALRSSSTLDGIRQQIH
ncbi:MAG TPA: ATP-binding protein [Candidatus Saccharimonadia bacterium]